MFFQKQLKRGIEMNIAYHNTVVYISQELNYNIATTSFMSRGLDNLQATTQELNYNIATTSFIKN